MPCGLLVSELVTNALKHAFVGRSGGAIEVAAVRDGAAVTLSVTDDGAGLPPEVDPTTGATLGLRLVRALTDQLGGRLTIDRSRGTRVAITFDPAGDVPE